MPGLQHFDTLQLVALAAALGFASGLRLYAVLFIVGGIGYEISVFLNNHLWWLASKPDLKEKLNDAVLRFSEAFEIEPRDLRKWAFAQIVLSAWWTFEENGENWENELAFAEIWEV